MLQNKKILLAITGSIAAYKAATLVRLLVKNGAEVKVIMTKAAEAFIPALTLSTLSKNNVLTDLFSDDTWANHVALGRWADVMVVAPASCNTISKMANGLCDNLLLAVYLSATCPVMVAPAMDEDMWQHSSTQQNLKKLLEYDNIILPVDDGELASGLYGMGRMSEPEFILKCIATHFVKENDLLNKNILITAGPTYEPLDPVRFIGNFSTGKMGIALAQVCKNRGAHVHLVLGPTAQTIPNGVKVTNVHTAAQMYEACMADAATYDIAILSAAVADYTPTITENEKIKKKDSTFTIELKKTIDILQSLGNLKKDNQTLVGFALETNNEAIHAAAKLKNKKADFIVLNSLNDKAAGFGHDSNKISIFSKNGELVNFDLKSKLLVAEDIINTILK